MVSKRAGSPMAAGPKRARRPYKRPYRVPRSLASCQTLGTTRTSFSSTWAFGTATTNDFWRYYTFTAGDINNFGDFSALFDEYRIKAVKVTFRPAYDSVTNPAPATTTLFQPQAYAHVCVDPDSVTIPSGTYISSNMNVFLENPGVKSYTLNKPVSVYTKLKVADQVFGGGTAARLVEAPWLKTTETNVQHRGFHMFVQQNSFSTGNVNIKLDTFYTFYLEFRNVR